MEDDHALLFKKLVSILDGFLVDSFIVGEVALVIQSLASLLAVSRCKFGDPRYSPAGPDLASA